MTLHTEYDIPKRSIISQPDSKIANKALSVSQIIHLQFSDCHVLISCKPRSEAKSVIIGRSGKTLHTADSKGPAMSQD